MQLTAKLCAQTCCTWSRIRKLLKIRHGNRGKWAGNRIVKKSGSICLTLVDGSVCCNIPAERAKTRRSYVIYWTYEVNSGGSETERPWYICMQIIIVWNGMLAVNNDSMNFKQYDCALNDCWYVSKVSINGASTIWVWSFWQWKGCIVTLIKRGVIGQLWTYNAKQYARCPIMEMSINGASPISGLNCWIITGLRNSTKP